MIKTILAALSLSVLAGCATQSDVEFVRFASESVRHEEGAKIIQSTIGSGVQWNNDYVVTAKHVVVDPLSGATEYTCDSGCDLKFIRRKAETQLPQWREVKPFESLSAAGVTLEQNPEKTRIVRKTIITKGADANLFTRTTLQGESWLNMAQMDTVSGMSGGPLYSRDNKVVGILTSAIMLKQVNGELLNEQGKKIATLKDAPNPAIEGKLLPYAVYVPYSMIQQQWAKFERQRQQAAN